MRTFPPGSLKRKNVLPNAAEFDVAVLICATSSSSGNGGRGSVQNFSHIDRGPTLAQAVMAPLICWSFSSSMFR
jgi:hypothetical protein